MLLVVLIFSLASENLNFTRFVGIRANRKVSDGRKITQLKIRGQQVNLFGLKPPVHISWYWLKREGGKREKRFVVSTKPLKGITISRQEVVVAGKSKAGSRRLNIVLVFIVSVNILTLESIVGWSYRCLLFLSAHWAYLLTGSPSIPDWGYAAQLALESFLPQLVILLLLLEIDRLQPLFRRHGFQLQLSSCKI